MKEAEALRDYIVMLTWADAAGRKQALALLDALCAAHEARERELRSDRDDYQKCYLRAAGSNEAMREAHRELYEQLEQVTLRLDEEKVPEDIRDAMDLIWSRLLTSEDHAALNSRGHVNVLRKHLPETP